MKSINKKQIGITTLLMAFCATLFSFSTPKGGEGFEIYLNSKLVVQQFGAKMNDVQTINLDQKLSNSQLSVKYFHCGQAGKNRSITIRDDKNKILKEWKYTNTAAASIAISDAAMVCKVSDILGLQKNNTAKLSLYYTSAELPKGRLLANIVIDANNVAKR